MSNVRSTSPADLGGKYLTFYLLNEEYGVQILKVQEIIGLLDITPVPRMPPWVRGVMNLRGKIIPVVDLRVKFQMSGPPGKPEEQCIIVVHPRGVPMGLLVDRVSEVRMIKPDDISAAPAMGVETSHLLGIAKTDGRVRLLLDIEHVLAAGELASQAA